MIGLTHVKLPMLLAALLFGSGPALGQSRGTVPVPLPEPALSLEDAWVINNAGGNARIGGSIAEVRERLMSRFRQADLDGSGGITPADLELRQQIQSAQVRASMISRWAQSDLDGDGKVTRGEIATAFARTTAQPVRVGGSTVAPTDAQRQQATDQHVAKEMIADSDGDGIITFEEAHRHANGIVAKQTSGAWQAQQSSIPDIFDTNRDGTIGFAEFADAVSRVLARLDANNNGTVDAAEVEAFAALQKAARAVQSQQRVVDQFRRGIAARAAECAIPKIPEDVTAIQLEADYGAALSDVSLGGDDTIVTVIDVVIEKGEKPLYIIASSRGAMIWRVTGATQRVRHFVAASQSRVISGKGTHTGVSGLDAAVVHLVSRPDCFSTIAGGTMRTDVTAQVQSILLQSLLGREPDLTVRAPPGNRPGTVARFELPSGTLHLTAAYSGAHKQPTSGPSAVLWQDLLRGRSGGVVDIDPATLVSVAAPRDYDVLPGIFGLAQLVDQGALEPVEFTPGWRHPDGRVDVGSQMKSKAGSPGYFEAPTAFRIVKPMRMPPGHLSVYGMTPKFILAPGMPMPANLQTGTCILAEQTREILSGRGRSNCH